MPYRIHTILTVNGVQFVDRYLGVWQFGFGQSLGHTCQSNNIEHRLTKLYHPLVNGQTERMVKTIKESTVKSFHCGSIHELRRHVADGLIAYNFANQFKALKFMTDCEAIEQLWKSKPDAFIVKSYRHMLGPNI